MPRRGARETNVDMDMILTGLRAAAEPTRLRIVALCARAELTVSELTQILAQSQPRVSRHLRLLGEGGLLERSREGTSAFYRLARHGPGADLARLVAGLIAAPEGVTDALASLDRERLEAVQRARAAAAAAYFRANAASWDEIRSLYVDEGEVEKALLGLIPEGEVHDLLDIGTGTGRMLEVLAERIETGVGIDLSREMLAIARSRLEKAGHHHCSVRQGDMYRLPWPGHSFDAVTIHQVLHFADAPARAIEEAARVLRPGGRMVVVDFVPHDLKYLRDTHAHRRLGCSNEEVAGWFGDAGLEPAETIHLRGDPLTVGVWLAIRPRNRGAAGSRRPGAARLSAGSSHERRPQP